MILRNNTEEKHSLFWNELTFKNVSSNQMTIETTIHHPSSNLILLASEHALAKAYCLDSKES